jgi:hypothetical protein
MERRAAAAEQQEDGVPVPMMNSIVSELRFLVIHTLDRPDLRAGSSGWRIGATCPGY